MLALFILSQIFLLAKQDYKIIIDIPFKEIEENDIRFISEKNISNFYYRGRPKNIGKIKDHKSNEDVVYIGKKTDLSTISDFSNSTIFIIPKELIPFCDKSKYYFMSVSNDSSLFQENSKFFYVIIGQELPNNLADATICFIIIFTIFIIGIIIIYKCYNVREIANRLFIYSLAFNYIHVSILIISSCLILQFDTIFYLLYPLYKSYLIIQICYLLNGFSIIISQSRKKRMKYTIILEIIENILSIIFIYIVFFFPSLDNFYLFFAKSLIEHITILVLGIIFFRNFMQLYRQYRLQRVFRTILTLYYKYKLLLYSRVFIFSFFYCLGFIVLDLIQIIYRINRYTNGFNYIYYMNICLELFFCIILNVVFYPLTNPLFVLYNFERNIMNIDDNVYFIAEIREKKEKNLKINNLNEKLLKNEYLKKEYPLILVEPFAKANNLFNDMKMHIGITKNS